MTNAPRRLFVRHETRYRFDAPVRFALQQVRKTPKSSPDQEVDVWRTGISSGQQEAVFEDHHRNTTELISVTGDVTQVDVICEGTVTLSNDSGILGAHLGPSPLWLYQRQTPQTTAGTRVKRLVEGRGTEVSDLHDLCAAIREDVTYEVGSSAPDWTAEQALAEGRGVCQDQTHVFLAAARALGIPARYISGYLMLDDQTTQSAMHAWAEAHLPHIGWVGFDVSNGVSPDTRYVRVATGLDYTEAAPISGMRIGGASEHLEVQIEVAQQ